MNTNKMQPLVSIIVPVYKVEKYLDKCIDSIVKQRYGNLEIILVDDGSPDNCGKICDMWREKDPRIVVIHKSNGGLSDARNAGISKSHGDYLTFIDSDDYISEDFIQHLVDRAEETGADIAVCSVKNVYEPGVSEEINEETFTLDEKVVSGRDVIKEYYCHNKTVLITAWAKLYKKEVFNSVYYPVGKLYEDALVFMSIYMNDYKVVYLHEAMYYYLHRPGSIMALEVNDTRINEQLAYRQMHCEALKDDEELLELAAIEYCNSIIHLGKSLSKYTKDLKWQRSLRHYTRVIWNSRNVRLRQRIKFMVACIDLRLLWQ